MKPLSRIIISIFLLCITLPSRGSEPSIRVEIISDEKTIEITSLGNCTAESKTGSKKIHLSPNQKYRITNDGKEQIILEGNQHQAATFSSPMIIKVLDLSGEIRIDQPRAKNRTARRYVGQLEIVANNRGRLQVISELPLEQYLRGVVPSEIGATAPIESIKAQAVAARTFALAQLRNSSGQGNNFDLHADISSQVYSGITYATTRTDTAIRQTSGEALYFGNNLITANYHSNSGGHTENVEMIWRNGRGIPYLKGHWDYSSPFPYDLTKESDCRKWFMQQPPSYAFPASTEVPAWAKKKYRWTRHIPAKSLTDWVNRKKAIGNVEEIRPVLRGVSGRIIEMELRGSKGSLKLTNQMDIRQLFHPTLASSAFVIDEERTKVGDRIFVLHGAGSGHGAGMSQVGAMGMAAQGKTYREILQFYYPGTTLKKAF